MTLEDLEKKLTELNDLRSELNKLDDLRMELNKHIAELKARGEEKPDPPHPRPYPERQQKYFYVNPMGKVVASNWLLDQIDMDTREIGNVFKTEAEAKFAAERLKVLAEMREWAGKNYDGAYIYYHRPSDEIMINWDGDSTYCFGDIRFKCVDDAENCITAVGADRIKKYYFMISED